MEWRDCVVIYIDLIDTKNRAKSVRSLLMRSFHELVVNEMEWGLASLDHAYVWNDSALLLAFVDKSSGAYQACLRDAQSLKRSLRSIAKSYAIAVKGQPFPRLHESKHDGGRIKNGRTTVLRTSSYAMANCFEIEREVKENKELRSVWYLDERIAKHLRALKPDGAFEMKFLPELKSRSVYRYNRDLWN
jgi:hypothetical protein